MNENLDDDIEMETKLDTINWNDKLEETAKLIGEECRGLKTMHLESSIRYEKYHTYIMTIGMLLGPISGTLSGIKAALGDNIVELSSFSILCGYISGIVIAIANYGNFDYISQSNKQSAAKYTSLEGNIRRQMSLYRNDRINAIQYLQWIETKFDDLFISSPIIPTDIYKKYEIEALSKGKIVPGKYKETIIINKEHKHYQDVQNTSDIKINTSKIIRENNENINVTSSPPPQYSRFHISTISKIATIPEINTYSDKMLEYEMNRLIKN